MNLQNLLVDLNAVLPELILCLFICCILVTDLLTPLAQSRKSSGSLALFGLAIAFISTALQLYMVSMGAAPLYFNRLISFDRLAVVFKLVILGGAFITFIFSMRSRELKDLRFGEYSMLFLGATAGACLLASSNNFVLFLLALETLSMCSYVLAAYLKNQRFSAEAGLKYTLFGATASGVMLFGLGYLYGLSGSLDIQRCMTALVPAFLMEHGALAAYIGLFLVLAGVGFKMAVFPFHFWCPDTYQGAPVPVTAFLSVVSKAAGFAALCRLLYPVLASTQFSATITGSPDLNLLQILLGALAVLTMTFGNLVALRQTDVKRLLAYSAIAHAGYLLMAAAVLQSQAFEALLLYIVIYLFMNLGAFWVIVVLTNRSGSAELSSFKGAAYTAPLLFVAMFTCLVSLTGIPPTAGFAAKFVLFQAVIGAGLQGMSSSGAWGAATVFFFLLALIAAVNSVISLYYYMKVARVMVFEKPAAPEALRSSSLDNALALALAIPVIVLLYFSPVASFVSGSFGSPEPLPSFEGVEIAGGQ